jgi:hypothetical protein
MIALERALEIKHAIIEKLIDFLFEAEVYEFLGDEDDLASNKLAAQVYKFERAQMVERLNAHDLVPVSSGAMAHQHMLRRDRLDSPMQKAACGVIGYGSFFIDANVEPGRLCPACYEAVTKMLEGTE